MEFTAKDGSVVTEEMLNKLGEAADRGEFPGTPGEWIIRPQGRPELFPGEELVSITFKAPAAYRDLLDSKAKAHHSSRSQYIRSVLDNAML